jgi:signal transduction histidine kinase
VVSLLLAGGLYVVTRDLEKRLVDEALTAEIEDYARRLDSNAHSLPPATANLRGYVAPDGARSKIPEEIRNLGPGRYQMVWAGHPYRVAVADVQGKRFYLLYNESQLLRQRGYFMAYLAGGVLLMVLMSAAGARWLAGAVISPVTELAQRVQGLGPEGTARALVEDFPRDEVGQLANACDGYLDRLRGFIDRERAFTADVSHELRTPLAVINGALEVLEADSSLPERARDRISRIERAAREMSELSTALLVLAREEANGAPSSERSAVEPVLRDVVEKHRYLLRDKPVEVALLISEADTVPVERTLLGIVLGNLVRNAFMYTHQGLIRIRLDRTGVSIEDTGPGMGQEELAHAFDRHYRGRGSRGEGIGLSLVKRICERFGWQVSLSSQEGRGTSVSVAFSTARPEETAGTLPAQPSSASA